MRARTLLLSLSLLVFTGGVGATYADDASITYNSPADDASLYGTPHDVTFDFDLTAEAGTVELQYSDGTVINSWSHSAGSGTPYSHTETFDSTGTYYWEVQYHGDDGSSTTFALQSFSIQDDAQSVSFTLNNPNDGATLTGAPHDVTYDFSVTGEAGTLYLREDGTAIKQWSHPGTSNEPYSYTSTGVSEGSHSWVVEYTGDDGSTTDSSTRSYTVQSDADAATITLGEPDDGDTRVGDGDSVTYDFDIEAPSGTVDLVHDGTVINSWSHAGSSDTYSYTKSSVSSGSHTWKVEYTGDDGSTQSDSNTYDVVTDAEDASITLESPGEGETLIGDGSQFWFNSTVTGESGTVELLIDGASQNSWSHGGSSGIPYSHQTSIAAGSHSYTYKYTGDDGSTTSKSNSFTVETDASNVNLGQSSPSNGATLTSSDVTYNYSIDGSGSGTVALVSDTCSQSLAALTSDTFAGGSSLALSHTETLDCDSTFDWHLQFTGDDGSTTATSGWTFTTDLPTDAEQTNLTQQQPSDGATLTGDGENVTFEVLKEGNDGALELYLDNSKVHTWALSCSGCTETVTHSQSVSAGSHSWHVKYVGSDGSTEITSADSFTVQTDAAATNVTPAFPEQG